MGCNIGTSVTGILVSFANVTNKDRFRRSFSGATINDMFNILSVLVFLPIELASGYLEKLTGLIVGATGSSSVSNPDFMKAITQPLIKLIIQLDYNALKNIGLEGSFGNESLILRCDQCNHLFKTANIPEWSIGIFKL
jgi:solute carrier family 34 (sodium-dependent phosphate cotransporter)